MNLRFEVLSEIKVKDLCILYKLETSYLSFTLSNHFLAYDKEKNNTESIIITSGNTLDKALMLSSKTDQLQLRLQVQIPFIGSQCVTQ